MELTPEQITEILSSNRTHWLQIVAWFAQILVLGALAVAAWNARLQIRQSTKATNARLMLDLDMRWDSPDMQETRRLFGDTNSDLVAIVSNDFPQANDAAREQKVREKWTEHLRNLREQDVQNYTKLMSMCGFFETVGLMVKKNYVSKSDMLDLFEGPIVAIGRCYGGHIEERSKEMGVPKGLYEHALEICENAYSERS